MSGLENGTVRIVQVHSFHLPVGPVKETAYGSRITRIVDLSKEWTWASLLLFMIFIPKIRNVLIVLSDHLNIETFLTNRWCTRHFRIQIFRHKHIYSDTFQTRMKKVTTKDLSEEEANKEKAPFSSRKIKEVQILKLKKIPR